MDDAHDSGDESDYGRRSETKVGNQQGLQRDVLEIVDLMWLVV